jgi:hypothetical protein
LEEGGELDASLLPAARDCYGPGVAPREPLCRHGGRRARSENRDLDRVENGERDAVLGIEENDDPLDRGETGPPAVAGEVRVRLGREVGAAGQLETRSLDVETAARGGDPQDGGREGFTPRVQPEGLLDRVDALRKREEVGDVAPSEENRFPFEGWRAGGQEIFSAGPELLPGSSSNSRARGAPSESRPIGPTNFSAARQIARGRVGAVTVIRLT